MNRMPSSRPSESFEDWAQEHGIATTRSDATHSSGQRRGPVEAEATPLHRFSSSTYGSITQLRTLERKYGNVCGERDGSGSRSLRSVPPPVALALFEKETLLGSGRFCCSSFLSWELALILQTSQVVRGTVGLGFAILALAAPAVSVLLTIQVSVSPATGCAGSYMKETSGSRSGTGIPARDSLPVELEARQSRPGRPRHSARRSRGSFRSVSPQPCCPIRQRNFGYQQTLASPDPAFETRLFDILRFRIFCG